MATAFFITIVLGLISVLLSFEVDKLKKLNLREKKLQEDKIYKLSVFKEVQEKIAYTKEVENVIDTIMAYLRNFFTYSAAASMVIKDANVIFKVYAEEEISSNYVNQVEKSMLQSFLELLGTSGKIDKKIYGLPLNDAGKSTFSSSFHIPLIVNNKVLALIHLSSTAQNAYKNMEDLGSLIGAATTSLTNLNKIIETQTYKFTSLISSLEDGILMADNKNCLLFINYSAKNILGISKENLNFSDVENSFSKNFNLGSKISEVIMTNRQFETKEIQVGDKVLNVFINPIGENKVSIVLHDMTEYKKREILKEDLVHIMVHELRAPVTTIKDSAELIISTKDTLEEDKKMKFLEIIHLQAKKVLEQIGSILDTAKLDAGKLVLQKMKGDIAELIESEVQIFTAQAEKKNISLTFDVLTHPIPLIFFDPIKITQAIDNLLSNSLKFTEESGKVKVEIDYKTIPPKLGGSSPMGEFLSLDKQIVVSVSDNGVGIDKDQQKLLFSKYTQAQGAPKQIAKLGTGLGLYVVKGIVQSHGGHVWVNSAPGQGTTISFTLPTTQDAQKTFDDPKSSASPLSKLAKTVN